MQYILERVFTMKGLFRKYNKYHNMMHVWIVVFFSVWYFLVQTFVHRFLVDPILISPLWANQILVISMLNWDKVQLFTTCTCIWYTYFFKCKSIKVSYPQIWIQAENLRDFNWFIADEIWHSGLSSEKF